MADNEMTALRHSRKFAIFATRLSMTVTVTGKVFLKYTGIWRYRLEKTYMDVDDVAHGEDSDLPHMMMRLCSFCKYPNSNSWTELVEGYIDNCQETSTTSPAGQTMLKNVIYMYTELALVLQIGFDQQNVKA